LNSSTPARQVIFDSTPEIFATDNAGRFLFDLKDGSSHQLDTRYFDEVRFVVSLWHPSRKRAIDLDRAYVELACSFDEKETQWVKLAEIEPVVPPYNAGETFDGWIVLPVMGTTTAYALIGSGFEPRARLQIRASAYLVA
jgi:hypothetical protein